MYWLQHFKFWNNNSLSLWMFVQFINFYVIKISFVTFSFLQANEFNKIKSMLTFEEFALKKMWRKLISQSEFIDMLKMDI